MLHGSNCGTTSGEGKESRYYSILAETTDCSMKEQLALIFGFVYKQKQH